MARANRRNVRTANRTRINIDRDLVQNITTRIQTLLNRRNGSWNGTMTELNQAITSGLRRATPTNWPKTPSVLRRVINSVVPGLRRSGVRVQFGRTTDHSRTRFVSFTQN
jgi:hypothetical protein